MTLVVAGHYLNKYGFSDAHDGRAYGLFAASDSSITKGAEILVTGFKKVVEIPIKIKGVNFCGDLFQGYHGYREEASCFVAFAGSTLVAQHLMNSIRNHLGSLYPIYEDGSYKLAMPCENHRHLNGYYDNSMFLPKHFDGLLSGEYVSSVVRHSLESVVDQAKKYDGMKNNFVAFNTEFILGVHCKKNDSFYLYQYEILRGEDGEVAVNVIKIPKGDVAVIGLRQLFGEKANDHFKDMLKKKVDVAKKMHEFVANVIDDQNGIGVFSIGKPCPLYLCTRQKIKRPNIVQILIN